ncbi:DUF4925 domain-containing protein [Phocaeicola barnesiae]|uniref:DUF4925 domain-containing protein n=1 Tax=Phocaeicola barnesiae TaxID=376804 RepID=UPI0025A38EDF|nr:DUF4925 domain-containing protein [Phocaeicola barnesiae]MDM8256114.1 DUF4925 domain-containing protein [Phocaeicola barnesiae]
MKKRLLFCLMAGLACGGFFTSCSDDDDPTTDEVVICPIAQTTYTDASGLVLTYSGQPVLGKQVVFTPDANDGSKATLTISGVLDLSSFTGLMNSRENASATLAAPGVIPGQTTTNLTVDLTVSGDEVSFKGTTDQDGCTIAYEGSASEGGLTLNLNVTMPANDLTGATWTISGEAPIHFVWESDKQISIVPGMLDMPIGDIINLALSFPLLGEQTVNGALTQVFHSVTFGTDGNITAEYKKNMTDAEWATSPLNVAQYTANSGSLRLFLNPSMIIANIQNAGLSRSTTSDILANLMPVVLPMLSQGVPMKYVIEDNNMKVYLGTDVLLPLLEALAPMFQDEAFLQQIMDMVANDPTMGAMAGMVGPVLEQLPDVIAGTTNMEVGVNFQK